MDAPSKYFKLNRQGGVTTFVHVFISSLDEFKVTFLLLLHAAGSRKRRLGIPFAHESFEVGNFDL